MFWRAPPRADGCAEMVGTYFLERWRLLLSLLAGAGLSYGLYSYTPDTLTGLLLGLGDFLLHTLPRFFESVQASCPDSLRVFRQVGAGREEKLN